MSKASEPAKRRRFARRGSSKTHLVAIGIALGGVALLAGLVSAGGALKGWWRERQRARADELVGEIERRLKEGSFAAAAQLRAEFDDLAESALPPNRRWAANEVVERCRRDAREVLDENLKKREYEAARREIERLEALESALNPGDDTWRERFEESLGPHVSERCVDVFDVGIEMEEAFRGQWKFFRRFAPTGIREPLDAMAADTAKEPFRPYWVHMDLRGFESYRKTEFEEKLLEALRESDTSSKYYPTIREPDWGRQSGRGRVYVVARIGHDVYVGNYGQMFKLPVALVVGIRGTTWEGDGVWDAAHITKADEYAPESFTTLGTGDAMMYSKEKKYYAGLRDSVLKQIRTKTVPPAFYVRDLRETVEAEAGF